MKTAYLMRLAIIATLIFASCTSEDDSADVTVTAPAITFANTTLESIFFTDGNSETPSIAWNGEVGNLSLVSNENAFTLDETTGRISWTKELPAGTYTIEVVAANSAGQTVTNLTINNPLQGFFEGTYSDGPYFAIDFREDGSVEVLANSANDPDIAPGEWSITNDGSILVDYTYEFGGGNFSTLGFITLGNSAIYTGEWYSGYGALEGNEGDVFEMTLIE